MDGDKATFQLPENQNYSTPRDEALGLSDQLIGRVGEEMNEGAEISRLTEFIGQRTRDIVDTRNYFIAQASTDVEIAGFSDRKTFDDQDYRRAA